MELITYKTKIHEANISEIEVDYDMNEPDMGITSSHYSNNKASMRYRRIWYKTRNSD